MIIDLHVHVVGNGSGGSGCWMRPGGLHRLLGKYMLHHNGLPAAAWDGDLEAHLSERLAALVRESSLDAVVILAHDQVHGADGKLRREAGTFHVPNSYILELARRHPNLFLPAVSIHPARADALDELERCLAGGAVLMKLLPNCQDIDCNDRRYMKFWERMAAARLPLLAHTGGEHTIQVLRREFAHPSILELPLACGVTCIAAHCAAAGGPTDPDYLGDLVRLMDRYPNLYADIAAFNIPFRSKHYGDCLREPLRSRLVHGSDFPVPVHGHWAWARGLVDWATFRRWERHPNPLERDYQLKRAIGIPDAIFTRAATLLRRSA